MKRLILATLGAALLATTSIVTVQPAFAQMAGALGKPLPASDLPAGTVSVRVVAGASLKSVIGSEVTLLVDGTPRVARTGDDGRAVFKDIGSSTIQAVVRDADGKEIKSDAFPMPGSGVKVLLSTVPFAPGASSPGPAGASLPTGAGAAAMPNPRQMSGEPRPEQADPAGMFTVRLTYDDFKDAPPVGVPVALVGYHADDKIDMQVVPSDAEGRAQFKGLDRTGGTSYFAMTLIERNGKLERLLSTPAILDARSGVRLILSAEKRTSTDPSVDDLERFEKQGTPPPPGKIRITLEGGVDFSSLVSLVELTPTERRVFGTAKPTAGPPDPSELQARADFKPTPGVAANTVIVHVHGGIASSSDTGLEGASVMIAPEAAVASRTGQVDAKTGADGKVLVNVDPTLKGPLVAVLTINGKELLSQPFDLAASGGTLDVEARWESEGKPQAEFDVIPRPGQVFFAEARMHGQLYRSLPFQPVPDRGTRASIFVFPRVLFTFSVTSRVDDKYLAVNGRFEVSNNAWAPYVGGPDGLLIPLPRGFVGGLVAEKDQGDVAIVPGEGFRLIRPLPPGQKKFHGAFSLHVEEGGVMWNLDLPLGSYNSGMEILQPPGMQVTTPPGVRGETMTVPAGTFFVLPNISILPRQSMVMTIRGLPQPPSWKVWLPRIFGGLVIVIIVTGIAAALLRRREPTVAEREAHRQELLDELVELEQATKTAKTTRRREEIMAELESMWTDAHAGSQTTSQPPA